MLMPIIRLSIFGCPKDEISNLYPVSKYTFRAEEREFHTGFSEKVLGYSNV